MFILLFIAFFLKKIIDFIIRESLNPTKKKKTCFAGIDLFTINHLLLKL
jgi:hypothetical protein